MMPSLTMRTAWELTTIVLRLWLFGLIVVSIGIGVGLHLPPPARVSTCFQATRHGAPCLIPWRW